MSPLDEQNESARWPLLLVALMLFGVGCGKVLHNEFSPRSKSSLNIDPEEGEGTYMNLRADHKKKVVRLASLDAFPSPRILDIYHELTGATVEHTIYTNYADIRRMCLFANDYDVAIIPNELLEVLIFQKRLRPLRAAEIPVLKHFRSSPDAIGLKNFPEIDPKFKYSIPYVLARSGVAYDSRFFANLYDHQWGEFFNPVEAFPRLKHILDKRVDIVVDYRTMMGMALLAGGASVNSGEPLEVSDAGQRLMDLSHVLGNFDREQFIHRMETNAAILGFCWEHDARRVAQQNSKVQFIVPKEGSIAYVDFFVLSRKTREPELGAHLIRFLTHPEIAAEVSNETLGRTVIPGAEPYLSAGQAADAGFEAADSSSTDYYLREVLEESDVQYDWYWEMFTNSSSGKPNLDSLGIWVNVASNATLGTTDEWWITIANNGSTTLKGVWVTAESPKNAPIIEARNGEISPDENRVRWTFDTLGVGNIQTVSCKVRGIAPGEITAKVTARSEKGVSAEKVFRTMWRGVPAYNLKLVGAVNPLFIGYTNTYFLTMENEGMGGDSNVVTTVYFPKELQPLTVSGFTPGKIVDGLTNWFVKLDPVAKLDAAEKVAWTITAKGVSQGDVSVKVEATAASLSTNSVATRTTTRVF